MKTYAIRNTNNRSGNMGCDSKYGSLGIFLPTWHGGRCHACLCGNHGFHRGWSCYESGTENVPQKAKLRVFLSILLAMALKKEKICLLLSRKVPIIRDKAIGSHMEHNIANKILSRIYGLGRGKVFTPKDFLDLGSHEIVRQSLSRLAKEGKIRRLMRGVYEYPAFSRLLDAPANPDPDAIAQAIARAHGWTLIPSGETALNILGLSTQITAQWQYFSDGPSKKFDWQGGTLILKHRTNKETSKLSSMTALVVQALKALGEDNVDKSVPAILRKKLDSAERNRAAREARYVTSWIYEIIKKVAAEEKSLNA